MGELFPPVKTSRRIRATPQMREEEQRRRRHGMDARQLFRHTVNSIFMVTFPRDKRGREVPKLVQTHYNRLDERGAYVPLPAQVKSKKAGRR